MKGILFHRMGRGVRLTEMGKAFLPFAERALDQLKQGEDAVVAARQALGGMLTIASARTIGTYSLPTMLDRFRTKFPAIKLHIKVGRSSDVLNMVVDEEAHLGLARELHHPDVLTMPLYEEEIVLVAHPKHPFALKGKASIYEIAKEPLILYDPGSAYFVLIQEVCQEAGVVPRVEMNLDSIEATKRMVEIGFGVSFLPLGAIERELHQKSLVHVPLTGAHRVVLPTCVLIRRAQHYSPATIAFLKILSDLYNAKIPLLKAEATTAKGPEPSQPAVKKSSR
jgi:DNA-binding transcriptional LysR family regulator